MHNRLSFKNAQVGGGEGGDMSTLAVDPEITTRKRVIVCLVQSGSAIGADQQPNYRGRARHGSDIFDALPRVD